MFPRNTRHFSSSIEQYQKTNLLSRKRIVARFVFKEIIERESEKIVVAIEKNSDDGEHEREKRMVGGGGRKREREQPRKRNEVASGKRKREERTEMPERTEQTRKAA